MRHSLLPLTAAAFLMVVGAGPSLAQRHEIPTLNSCIKEFYDPEMYNYLTYKNSCTQSLTVVFVAKDGSGATGTMDLRPGGKDSVGKLAGRSPKIGGFQLYVCPAGQVPMDADHKVVTKPQATVQCEPKSK